MKDDWKARIVHTSSPLELHHRATEPRTPLAQVFRRLVRTVIEPAFREVGDVAARAGIACSIEVEPGSRRPHAMFAVRPSGRSVRYELDVDGEAVRDLEGVSQRSFGQRHVWGNIDDLLRQLTPRYARLAATTLVDDQLRELGRMPSAGDA